MPSKHNAVRRHHTPRARYRVTDWPACEAGLRRRGDLTLRLDEAAVTYVESTTGGIVWTSDIGSSNQAELCSLEHGCYIDPAAGDRTLNVHALFNGAASRLHQTSVLSRHNPREVREDQTLRWSAWRRRHQQRARRRSHSSPTGLGDETAFGHLARISRRN